MSHDNESILDNITDAHAAFAAVLPKLGKLKTLLEAANQNMGILAQEQAAGRGNSEKALSVTEAVEGSLFRALAILD
jgi:hypothetical protein